jgi:hypothetical protein
MVALKTPASRRRFLSLGDTDPAGAHPVRGLFVT